MNTYFVLNAFVGDPVFQCGELWRLYQDFSKIHTLKKIFVICPDKVSSHFPFGNLPCTDVLLLYAPRYEPESILAAMQKLADPLGLYLFGSSSSGDELAVRLAFRLCGNSIIGLQKLIIEGDSIIAYKNVYSGNMLAGFEMRCPPFCLSLAKNLAASETPTIMNHKIEEHYVDLSVSDFVLNYSCEEVQEEVASKNAEIAIVVGKGVRTIQEIEEAKSLASLLGATLMASRPVVMQGLVPLNHLVGVSGLVINPRLCIAAGVSGAPAFFVGIEKSGQIISINTDPDAPIMKQADATVLGEYRRVFAALREYMEGHVEPLETEVEKWKIN